MYYRINLATMSIVSGPEELPHNLVGLADETLADLSPLKESVPEFDGIGFWPRVVAEAPDAGQEIDTENKRVVVNVPPATPATPMAVTPLQARKALRAAGVHAQVQAYVAGQSEEIQEAWEFASEIRRDDPIIAAAAAALGWTEQQLDQLFIAAAAF